MHVLSFVGALSLWKYVFLGYGNEKFEESPDMVAGVSMMRSPPLPMISYHNAWLPVCGDGGGGRYWGADGG